MSHDVHAHAPHAHHHHHHGPARPAAPESGWSLLRASAVGRIGGAAAAVALIWAGVFWAMS